MNADFIKGLRVKANSVAEAKENHKEEMRQKRYSRIEGKIGKELTRCSKNGKRKCVLFVSMKTGKCIATSRFFKRMVCRFNGIQEAKAFFKEFGNKHQREMSVIECNGTCYFHGNTCEGYKEYRLQF